MNRIDWITSEKVKKRLSFICAKYGRLSDFDDVYQSYCLNMLEGKGQSQTLDQFFIDYSRKSKWIKRGGGNLPLFSEINHETLSSCDLINIDEVIKILDNLTGSDRAIMILRYKHDLSLMEISEVFNSSESRISQIITKALGELKYENL